MAIMLAIFSTEGARPTATAIAASKQEMLDALDAVHAPTSFIDAAGNPELATRYLCRAWEVIGDHAEKLT